MSTTSSWHIRPATTVDRAFAAGLAARLLVGSAPWRDPEALLATFRAWLVENVEGQSDTAATYVAESPSGTPVGVVTVSAGKHFSGEPQAEIGELVVDEEAEGRGAGTALLEAAETWARAREYRFVSLGTGAANIRARAFHGYHGFREEDVRLTKPH